MVEAEQRGDDLRFVVQDNGKGIEESRLGAIRESFTMELGLEKDVRCRHLEQCNWQNHHGKTLQLQITGCVYTYTYIYMKEGTCKYK